MFGAAPDSVRRAHETFLVFLFAIVHSFCFSETDSWYESTTALDNLTMVGSRRTFYHANLFGGREEIQGI